MKKLLLLIIAAVAMASLAAQTEKPVKADKIFFTSFLGKGTVKGDLSSTASSGLQAMTGVEYKFNRHQSLSGELNFDGYSYKEITSAYSLSGSLTTIPITILYKYTFGKNKWLPFIKAGAGAARVSIPVINQKQGFTTIGTNTGFTSQAQVAVGINYAIARQYLIFTEAVYQQYGKLKLLSNQSFGVSAFRIGISGAL